jgi:hypothetical protein
MRRVWKRWWFWLAAVVVVAGNALVGLCWWHNVWSWDAWQAYQDLDRECHPAWRDYHYGRVKAGDPVDDVIIRTSPPAVRYKGRWTILVYNTPTSSWCFTGICFFTAAHDGKMVFAVAISRGWTRPFLDEMNEAQCQEFFGRSRKDPNPMGLKGPVIK